ncbi:MAG TPA: class I SAM-dependent methyltransferase [Solirubrobacterales bacterium]|nr:class I SAM-dependent methyltransferase [Solirubrobacterales bacterium]
MRAPVDGDLAKAAYDAFASVYDDFSHGYMYERWTRRLLEKAEEAGLAGNRLLDVACGTGLSFLSMMDRGFSVTACDISESMLEVALSKVEDGAELLVADMRALPDLGEFDLIWSLNDSLNYLLSPEELEQTLEGFARNLAAGGIALFDVNTPVTYRTFFSSEIAVERGDRRMVWRGQSVPAEVRPGSFHEARFEVKGEAGCDHVHRQRHFPRAEVVAAIEAAGLRCVAVYGELDGALSTPLDEEAHSKAVYLCRF